MTEDPLLRIARPEAPLADRVVSAVLDAISSGALVPGQRLTERQLIDWTGVSRTSIREALRQLSALRLVERAPSGGARIAILDRAAIKHIYEARSAIETAATELFIMKATEEEFAELVTLGRRYGIGVDDDVNRQVVVAPSRGYEVLLVHGAHNPILADMFLPLHTRIQGLRRLSMSMPGRPEASREEIRAIIDAVLARDPERAAAASRRHIAAAAEAALEAADKQAAPR